MKINKSNYFKILAIMFGLCISFCTLVNVKVNLKKYRYFIGKNIGISKKCIINDTQDCICLVDNKYIVVDGYSEE